MNQDITNETILAALNEFPLLKDMVIEVAEATQAPLELVLASALSTISLLCQPLIDVERPGKIIGPVSLMVISMAQSGERKSTVESMFMGVVRIFVINALKAHEKELLVWRIKSEAWEARKRKIIKEMSNHSENEPAYKHFENELIHHHELKPERPRAFNPIYEDATTAALLKGMRLDCPWAALTSSEGISALKGVFNDFGKINALWTGSTIDVARASVDGCSLTDARLTIGIMIQPQVLKEYLEEKGDRARSVGLLSRALVFNPESTQGKRFINKRPTNKEVIARYQSRAKQLLEKCVQRLQNITGDKEVINFSSDAAKYWTESYNKIEYELQKGGKYERSKDHASKLSENIARVAALLHYFEFGNGTISLTELKSAEKIVLECSKTFRDEFTFMPNIISNAEVLYAWLQLNCKHSTLFNWVEKNTILNKGPWKFRTLSKLNPILDCLEALGKVSVDYTVKPVRVVLNQNY